MKLLSSTMFKKSNKLTSDSGSITTLKGEVLRFFLGGEFLGNIFNLNIPFMESYDNILKYIEEECIWSEVKDLINYLLSLYIYIRVNSNFKESPIFPLGNDYYTRENTIVTYKTNVDSPEIYLDKIYVFQNIPIHNNYHTLISEEDTLDYFKKRLSRRGDLKLKLGENRLEGRCL